MEIRAYLSFLRARWWIVAAVFVLTLAATVLMTVRSARVYEATTTYIVGVGSSAVDEKNRISALDTLSNRAEIAGTYAKVANSRTIRNLAAQQLGLVSGSGLSVNAEIIGGTNVLQISVQGTNAALVRDYANAVGHQTSLYVQGMAENYELTALDQAVLPSAPVKPNTSQNVVLGAILGLALGLAVAVLTKYLQGPGEPDANFNILDRKTGIYNMPYLMLRLRQEMSRAKRSGHALSLAVVNVDHGDVIGRESPELRVQASRTAGAILGQFLRDEDVMAAKDDRTLVLLLPEASGAAAKAKVEKLVEKLNASPVEVDQTGAAFNLHAAGGVATYRREKVGEDRSPEDLLAEAERALAKIGTSVYGGVGSLEIGVAPEGLEERAAGLPTN